MFLSTKFDLFGVFVGTINDTKSRFKCSAELEFKNLRVVIIYKQFERHEKCKM